MHMIMIVILSLLAPIPRPTVEPDITDAVLIAQVWEMTWGHTRQECHFWIEGQSNYWSPQFGGGEFGVGKGGRVEFWEGSARYLMDIRREGTSLVGEGWRVYDDGSRGLPVSVRMVPKIKSED